jgi:hypothetical protein
MKKLNYYLILLLGFNILIYQKWISFSIFTFSDWQFHFNSALADLATPTTWSASQFYNYGVVDVVVWRLPIYLLNGLFGNLGFSSNVSEKFIYFWPIIFIASLGSFFLIRHVLKSNMGALIGSFVFSFNTYFLSIDTQGHQLLTVAFGFATFALLYFIKLLEVRKFYLAVFTGIFLFIVGSYDLRSLYITIGIMGIYLFYFIFMHFGNKKKDVIKLLGLGLIPLVLFFLLSQYWLLPILNVSALTSNTALGKQIFGSGFYNIQSALTTFFPFWTGKETAWFTIQQIHWYFWLYPLLAILGLIVNRKNSNVVFFALIAVIGIFLSKQADIPFTGIYGWLYENFPGFNAFREASKFDFMVSLGYAVLIGAFITWVWSRNWKKNWYYAKHIIIFLIALLALWNGKPMITGEIKSLFVPHVIPKEFLTIENLVFGQPEYFRTYWINMNFNWLFFNNTHPQIEGKLMLRSEWNPFFKNIFANKKRTEGENMILALKDKKMNNLLDLASVKYVIIPLYDRETGTDIVKGFGKSHQYYRSELSKIPYLKKVDKMPINILVYENENYRPHIYTTNNQETISDEQGYNDVEYEMMSPSEYKIKISNISKPVFLNFTDNFHPSWKMRIGEFSWVDALLRNDYFLPDKYHLRSEIGFNSFSIDPQDICKSYDCRKNSDGSYDIDMTLYFAPQSYLYLGMIISGSTLLLCLGYLAYYGIKKAKSKK